MSGFFFRDRLRPASWRGVPFAVLADDEEIARQVVVHQYPYRDEIWAEDLGAGPMPMSVVGFIVGDDAAGWRDAMRDAANQPGAGELVHPTRGTLSLVCLSLSIAARWDAGRYFELVFRFVRSGERLYPSSLPATSDAVAALADAADGASERSFLSRMGSALRSGIGAGKAALAVARRYQAQALGLAGDAAAALHAVGSLTGRNYMSGRLGRFFRGARTTLQGGVGGVNTVAGALGRLNTARAAVSRAGGTLVTTAGKLG